jgi:serine/threonine-protein kinase
MTDNMIGKTIGNFRLLRVLGEGGMGVVYEAEHVTMGRRAAVKMLRADSMRDEKTIHRFFNEARATNEVRHPGIVQIYDCGTTADGAPWLIMELLEGETLGSRLNHAGRLSPAEAVDIGAQSASVLAAAHAAGIVHRDLKPDNLFVVPDQPAAKGVRVKVLDFGIAKLAAGDSATSLRTQTGVLMGTPLYMSPEQCRGTKQVDFRSDIYSLGLIVYQMLAGRPPFVSEGFGELMHMQMNVPADPLGQMNPSVGPALAFAVAKALEKDPMARHANMTDFAEALIMSLGTSLAPGQPLPFSKSGGTLQLDWKTQPPLVGSTTLSSTAGELEEERPPARKRGGRVALIGALAVVVGAGAFIATRAAHNDAGGSTAPPPEAQNTGTVPPAEKPVEDKTVDKPVATHPSMPERPAEPPPVAAPARIAVDIETTPGEARLLDASDGHVLGVSPWRGELPSGQGSLKIRIEKQGYKARTITVPLDHAFNGTFELDRSGGHHGGGEQPSGERIIKL